MAPKRMYDYMLAPSLELLALELPSSEFSSLLLLNGTSTELVIKVCIHMPISTGSLPGFTYCIRVHHERCLFTSHPQNPKN
ncbi:hypothetical protein QUF86_13845 [Peribacillus sp. NJ11]|uniref:hypothetical protein n=1 Tax=Peribacillus sp. NJ11 TaxID=3055861 RepID=UPI0025A26A8E|nr:hypothetical protein [Peribacillus sp. NJ11]MDM5221800.1 hypothetical protein [Peribacillus sp. NJ11]